MHHMIVNAERKLQLFYVQEAFFTKRHPIRTLDSRFSSNQSNLRIQDFLFQMTEISGLSMTHYSKVINMYIQATTIIVDVSSDNQATNTL